MVYKTHRLGAIRNDLMVFHLGKAGNLPEGVKKLSDSELLEILVNEASVGSKLSTSDLDTLVENSRKALGQIVKRLAIVKLAPGVDPWEIAESTKNYLVPIRVFRGATHSSRMTEMSHSIAFDRFDLPIADSQARVVGVIDSGLPAEMPALIWVGKSIFAAHPGLDIEGTAQWEAMVPRDRQGHGLFVSSLVSRVSGATTVITKSATVDPDLVIDNDPDLSLEQLRLVATWTDELQILVAVNKLLSGGAKKGFDALNLSFGSFVDDVDDLESAGLLLRLALGVWAESYPNAQIFAAAGNVVAKTGHHVHGNFIPAAMERVVSVGSVDSPGGNLSNFSVDEFDISAVGRDTVGLVGRRARATTWSGTSFACAVATGDYVSRRGPRDPTDPDEIAFDPR